MVIPGGTRWLTTARAVSPVGVERFNPVVIFNAQLFRVGFAKPDDRPAARHVSISRFSLGGVDPPLLVRRQEIQRFFRKAVWRHGLHLADAAGINGRAIGYRGFRQKRASTDGPDTTAGGRRGCAMGSAHARWYNRHCRRRARFPVPTTSGWR